MTAIRMPGWWSAAPDSVAAAAMRQGRSPWHEMVHLLWSAWVFITPVFTPEGYSARWFVLTLTSYPLFVLLYAMSLRAPARHAYRYALGMVALSMVLLPVYPSGISYFVFGCVMMRLHRSRGAVSYLLQLLLLNAVFLGLFLADRRSLAVGGVAAGDDPGHRHRGQRRTRQQGEGRGAEALARRSAPARGHRRARAHRPRPARPARPYAVDGRVEVGTRRQAARRAIPKAARREIDEVAHVARDALAQVRRAVSGIRAAGIAAELASAKLLLETDGVAFRYARAELPLPPGVETALALIVREAVTNIQRHARATHARRGVRAPTAATSVLRIVDDGRGGAIVPGNGLNGMRERIEALGGRLRVDSQRRTGHAHRGARCRWRDGRRHDAAAR